MAQSALRSLKRPSKVLKRLVDAENGVNLVWYGLGEPLTLQGHYTVQVVKGAVELASVVVPASETIYKISAPLPPFYSLSPVHSLVVNNTSEATSELGGEAEEWLTIVKLDLAWSPPNLSQIAPPYKSLWTPTVERSGPVLEISPDWRKLSFGLPKSGASVLILGPKNSGKSSLAKFIANSRIAGDAPGPIYYLELDPGQCEFCLTGTLSLAKVDEMLFSPAWAHAGFDFNANILKAVPLGYTSPIETPQRYLEICHYLIELWRSLPDATNGVLIVNTPGWTKGLGLELNVVVSQMLDPSHVIHMGDDESSLGELNKLIPHNIQVLQSVLPTSVVEEDSVAKFSSSDLRNLQILAYFHHKNSSHITNWNPYELTEDQVHLSILDPDGMDIDDTLIAMEGTIVAILVTPQPIDQWVVPPDTLQQLLPTTQCVGYAVIQSFQATKTRLLTPFDPSILDPNTSVILCRGRQSMPLWLLYDASSPKESSPWISTSSSGVGGVYKKFRRNLKRN